MSKTVEQKRGVPTARARSLVEEVVVEMIERIDDSATMIADSIHEATGGELGNDMYLGTRQSTRANLGVITTLLSDGGDPTTFAAPEEALSYARAYVHEGLSFDLLIRAYREGEHAYQREWLRQLHKRARDAEELAESVSYVNDYLYEYIGAMNRPLSVVYTAEHERWIRGGVAMRSEEVRAILSGAQTDATQASSRLRYRVDGRHLAFVIWSQDPERAGGSHGRRVYDEMDRLGGELAQALDASSVLLLPIGSIYAGWAAVGTAPNLGAVPRSRGNLHIAVGRVARGLDGFRRSHEEALMARRVASLAERPSTSCVSFGNVALDALMTHDVEEARRFVHSELGPLLDDSDASRRLTATLEVFLQEESSFVRAARRLGIHENTVAYRVRRAEEMLGRRTIERQLELRAALRLAGFVRRDAAEL
jgi:DNA-binding PucR family transcriptional regulator